MLTCTKANLLILSCIEGKCSVYCRVPSKESRQLGFKRPNSLKVFWLGGLSLWHPSDSAPTSPPNPKACWLHGPGSPSSASARSSLSAQAQRCFFGILCLDCFHGSRSALQMLSSVLPLFESPRAETASASGGLSLPGSLDKQMLHEWAVKWGKSEN